MFDLYLLTFNCARTLANPQSLAPSFFDALPKDGPVPDLVAISLQEIAPIAYSFLGGSYLKPYFDRITTTVQLAADLHSHGSQRLEHVATRSLGMTALMIFAKPSFTQRIQWIQSAGAGVGFSNMGNKGAVAMRIGVSCPTSISDETLNLSFAAAHLAPSEKKVEARNKDWENLVRNLVFRNRDDSVYSLSEERPLLSSRRAPSEETGLFATGSHVFFFGDLNYRTHDSSPDEKAYEAYPSMKAPESSPKHYSQLLSCDQLTREKEANRTLHGLEELPITFPPTYKYSMSRSSDDEWQWAKHRYPSWCDRILYLPSQSSKLEPQIYTALPVQSTSDHRPVALSVRVEETPIPVHGSSVEAPFSINPTWKSRQEAARRWEVMVGASSYLALTRTGNAMLVAFLAVLAGGWWLAAWFAS
ncbi:Endonuclease/exonuclease/phosphatase [Boeremia exigua]|uniref:Endonuclease/exonuclease/phosphatase n=1 Tax=Boeremia exigua TaxID=749465 RepID=UPI001E8E573E|nr:Endonuclease/exonuclease/phosphatase [Boeremia exigua]KAH6644382.1 Endonuclease/exonuclease/phosphatase [Boeremia exigua]